MRWVIMFAIGVVLFSCQTNDGRDIIFRDDVKSDQNKENLVSFFENDNEIQTKKVVLDSVSYSIYSFSGEDYVRRIGKVVDPEDVESIKSESVFILEFESVDSSKSIRDQIKLSQDDFKAYMLREILNDIKIVQNNKEFTPNGVYFEDNVGFGKKIRANFFCSDIDINENYTVKYFDNIFKNGIIVFNQNNHNSIS